jgi:glycosyltransferase involved in cell wall biosynthesis
MTSSTGEPSVTFISSSSEFGGGEALMLDIIEGIGRGRVRRVVFLGEGPVVTDVRKREIPVTVLPSARRAGLAGAALRARRALRDGSASIVHANGVRAAIVATLATLGTRRRVVWLKVDCSRDGRTARAIGARCDRIVGISNTVLEVFRARTRKRTTVVYPGVRQRSVDRTEARKLTRRILGCPGKAEVVVLSARLSPSKGQLDLIEAAPAVLAERPDVQFALLGGEHWPWEGYEQVLRERAAALGVTDSTHFLGHRRPGIETADDVVRFVAGCDLLVAPSRFEPESGWREGFGYSPLEAMSVGVPVVAYRHGSFPEVLGDCARFVPEADVEALGREIVRVLGDEELAARLKECGPGQAARYPVESTVEGMKAVYAELA